MADIKTVTVGELDVAGTTEDSDRLLIETGDGRVKAVSKKNLLSEEAGTREAADTLLQGQITTLMGDGGLEEKANLSRRGSANGLAELDENGKIPMSQIPGGADDIRPCYGEVTWDEFGNVTGIEVYDDPEHTQRTVPESNIVYLDVGDTRSNHYEYMWAGDSETGAWGRLGSSLVIGEGASNAYRGDRGKEAYDHSQARGTGKETDRNPHALSPADIGLGNVPDVSTNDQAPTYEVAEENTELSSGETLSAALGKLARAVKSLIGHLADRTNPHGVTKAQVGLGSVENYGRDTAVRSDSGNYITGGAVYTAMGGKNDKITVTDDTSALTDSDSFDETPAGSNPTATRRRLLSSLWTYIRSKIASVLYIAYDGTRVKIDKSLLLKDTAHIYFGSTDDMAIGHGTPPAQFTEELQSGKLVTGAYMAYGNDETGGIIVGGDGIDMWAPPDRHLVRFWNEDMGIPVASIDSRGWLYGKARSAERGTVQYIGSWASLTNRIRNEMSELGSGDDEDNIVPGIYGFAGDGYIGSDTTFFVKGTGSPCPSTSYNRWIVTTRLTQDADDGDIYGVQVAWAVTSSMVTASYKRSFLGEDGWSAWVSAGGGISAQDAFNAAHPVGDTYTQYPQQADPHALYNKNGVTSTWTVVNYSGAFFRAEGTPAESFISAGSTLKKQVGQNKSHTHGLLLWDSDKREDISRSYGMKWNEACSSNIVVNGSSGGQSYFKEFYFSKMQIIEDSGGDECRPDNYTIRIWRRTA